MTQTKIVGLGGSLREPSRSRAALEVALDGAERAGATVELLDLHVLQLPMYSPELEADSPLVVHRLIETCYEADGMLWSSPMYNGSVSGSFKNAIDWLHMLGTREPPYLHDEVIGLISAAGGTQGLLGEEVVRVAERFARDPTLHRQVECDDAADRVGQA
jgi:FMN reductase